MNKYRLLIENIKNKRGVYFLGILSVALCNIAQVYFAHAMGYVVDFFNGDNLPEFLSSIDKKDQFFYLFLSILLARVFLFVGRVGWRLTLGRESHKISGKLKKLIWKNAKYYSFKNLVDEYPKGVLMNLANSDVNQAKFIFGFTLIGIIDVIFLTFFTLFSMLLINVNLTLISLAVLIVTPLGVRKLSQREIVLYERAQNELSSFNDLATQAVSTIKLQKLGKMAKFWLVKLLSSSEKYRKKRLDAQLTSLKYIPYMSSISICSYLILFTYGISQYTHGLISVGEFVAMQGLIFLLQDPITELGYIISEWRKSATSLKRLDDAYNNEKEGYLLEQASEELISQVNEESESNANELVLNLKNINFSYDREVPILKNFNLSVYKGERIGIKGNIGSGKSTIVNIMSGLERGFDGEFLIDGLTIDKYGHDQLRQKISVVHQRPFVFAGSIRDNVRMNLELSDEAIWRFLDLAGLKDDILSMENGLDTQLGEWGINISGGQKQRLTLARALARQSEILLLDDCLSAVDTVTEDKILNNLNNELSERTIVWVAHRDSTLKHCHKIITMEKI